VFYHFKNCRISLNNRNFLVSDLQLSQEVKLVNPYKSDDRISTNYLPDGPHIGRLSIKYNLTGQDYLKNFCLADENSRISGNVMGFLFNIGYLTSYNLIATPNSPVEIGAEISFFDKLAGSFVSSTPANYAGEMLNLYNCSIDNLSSFTINTISNVSQANFNYNSNIQPSYKYSDTGSPPSQPDRVNILERTISTEIISDSIIMDVPLSGENFGLTLNFRNSQNSVLESIGCSGKINYKSFNISSPGIHSHSIKINQSHLNAVGGISGSITGMGLFNIFSTNNSHPFTSNENSVNLVDKIMVGDSMVTGFTITRQPTYDQITCPTPLDVLDDTLVIYATNNTYIQSNPMHFDYPSIIVTGLSMYSGYPGTIINITGSNFYRISEVNYGGVKSTFTIVSPTLIQSVVPYAGITQKVNVISSRRNITGTSTGVFFCQPSISTITPVTGVWKDTITIGGLNLSGTTGVKFGNANAYSYTLLSNSIITAQTPETGAGFPSGYVSVLGSGGYAQSYSRYNPTVPIYSFDPISGAFYDKINIRTKVDTGYLFPTGYGYKVKFGNVDTIFYPSGYETNSNNKTGCLTGQIPFKATDDYIYIYQPDGINVYTPNSLQFNVISEPEIYSFSPSIINQYKIFTPVINGKNFKFFTQQPYYFALSGGQGGNVQFYTHIVSNSGGAADTLYVPSVSITGTTGLYTAIVQNMAGTAKFTGALQVLSGINQARFGGGTVASFDSSSWYNALADRRHAAGMASDGSFDTFAAINSDSTVSAYYLQLLANNIMDISQIYLYTSTGVSLINHTYNAYALSTGTGILSLYEKNASTPIFSSGFNGTNIINIPTLRSLNNPGEFSAYTGIQKIRIFSPKVPSPSSHYLAMKEVEIY